MPGDDVSAGAAGLLPILHGDRMGKSFSRWTCALANELNGLALCKGLTALQTHKFCSRVLAIVDAHRGVVRLRSGGRWRIFSSVTALHQGEAEGSAERDPNALCDAFSARHPTAPPLSIGGTRMRPASTSAFDFRRAHGTCWCTRQPRVVALSPSRPQTGAAESNRRPPHPKSGARPTPLAHRATP